MKNAHLHEQLKAMLEQRIAHVRAMSNEEVTDLYATQMVRLKTVMQWKREGRQGEQPCSYPDTWMMNICQSEISRRGLGIPHLTPLGICDECLLCVRGVSHTSEEHDHLLTYIQEIHRRVQAERSWNARESREDQAEPLARQHETEGAAHSPNACTVYEHAIEQGYLAGMVAHLAILPNHHGMPGMPDDAGFTRRVLDAFTPEGMSEHDTATLRTHFVAGWESVFRGLARKLTHCHRCNGYQPCSLMWWQKDDQTSILSHICKRCVLTNEGRFTAYVMGKRKEPKQS